jgi:hypothetical protein
MQQPVEVLKKYSAIVQMSLSRYAGQMNVQGHVLTEREARSLKPHPTDKGAMQYKLKGRLTRKFIPLVASVSIAGLTVKKVRKVRKNKGMKRGPRPKLVSPGSLGLKSLFKHVKAGPKVSTRGIAVPTGFLNTKRRVIMMTGQGKYIAKTSTGEKVYNPKAKFHKSPGGTERSTKYLKNLMDIPQAIRPKFDRKERSNILKKRGTYAPRVRGVRVLPVKRKSYISEMFEGYPAKRA